MNQLGLGININLDDDLSKRINPIVSELEKLKRSAKGTSDTFNSMRGDYNPYGSRRKREMQDYASAMKSTDRALLDVTQRMVKATVSANNLGKSMNRMQFTGNFNRMYSDITRVNNVLGKMGYAMSKTQKTASDMQAFNQVNYQFRELQDRIKLTEKAMKEMQSSPDSSKFTKEIALAKASLDAYKKELADVGSLQKKLAQTHGYGLTSTGGKDVLYNKAGSLGENLKLRAMSLTMRDMALASNIAYSSLDRTGKEMIGLGYTTMEARMKMTAMTMTLTTVGLALTQFGTVGTATAIAGLGMLVKTYEDAVNVMHARTLMPESQFKQTGHDVRDIAVDTGATQQDVSAGYSLAYSKYGKTKGLEYTAEMTKKAAFMQQVHGVSIEKSISDVDKIMGKLGVNSERAWDIYVAGAVKAKEETGKGFTGMKGMDRIMETIDKSPEKFKKLTTATGEFNGAFEKMQNNFEKGFFENMLESVYELGSTLIAIVEPLASSWDGFFAKVNSGFQSMTAFFRAHEGISKLVAVVGLLGSAFLIAIGPILLVTGFLIRQRNVIQGLGHAIAGFKKGGYAVLSPQAKMASDSIRAMTVAFARFPQTILKGALPALYAFVRGIPALILNIIKLNPIMSALTVGVLAYSNNWLGFKDTVDSVVKSITTSWTKAKKLFEGKDLFKNSFDTSKLNDLTLFFARAIGIVKMSSKIIKSIFNDEFILHFDENDMNLMRNLDIEGYVQWIVKAGKMTKDFLDGFVQGMEEAWETAKSFWGWLSDEVYPIIQKIGDGVTTVGDKINRFFGGDGIQSFSELADSANDLNEGMKTAGKYVGYLVAGLIAFKAVSMVFKTVAFLLSPFTKSLSASYRGVRRLNNAIKGIKSKNVTITTRRRTIDTGGGSTGGGSLSGGGLDTRTSRRMKKGFRVPIRWKISKPNFGKVFKSASAQGTRAGRRGGQGFLRGFTRGIRNIGRGIGRGLLATVKTGAKVGARLAGTLIKGLGRVVLRGIPLLFKVALRAIPILGWALLAWDLISMVFSNWDSIKSAAKTAWNWIKTTGVSLLKSAWDSIKKFASNTWNNIKSGASTLWESVKTMASNAWTNITTLASNAWNTILTSATTMATTIGLNIYTYISEKVTAVKSWFVDTMTSIPGAVADVGTNIGSTIFNGIKNALAGVGSWIKNKVSEAVGSIPLVGDIVPHAKGGLITNPHVGLVGEAGPEMIIPLSGSQRGRAKNLLMQTAMMMGMNVEKGKQDESVDVFAEKPKVNGNPKLNNAPVRKTFIKTKGMDESENGHSQESNSNTGISIGNIQVTIEKGDKLNADSGKDLVTVFAKELQKRMRQNKLRGKGKTLTIEELLLKM